MRLFVLICAVLLDQLPDFAFLVFDPAEDCLDGSVLKKGLWLGENLCVGSFQEAHTGSTALGVCVERNAIFESAAGASGGDGEDIGFDVTADGLDGERGAEEVLSDDFAASSFDDGVVLCEVFAEWVKGAVS